MPASTPLDNAMKSKNLLLAFAGAVTAVSVWAIFGTGDDGMFPRYSRDPTGSPEEWTIEEMSVWLTNRNLHPQDNATREELLDRVRANMRIPRD